MTPSLLISFTDEFKRACPFFLSIGVSYDEYWNGDCQITKYHLDAYNLKRDRMNEEAWLQGLYIYDAICKVTPILRAFPAKGAKAEPYPEKSYPLTEEEIKKRKEEQEQKRIDNIAEKLGRFATQFNTKLANKKEVDSNGGRGNN